MHTEMQVTNVMESTSRHIPKSAERSAESASATVYRRPVSDGTGSAHGLCACGGSCPRCAANEHLQTKLTVNEPGDQYEQEADLVADKVMRMETPEGALDEELDEESGP